MGFPCKLMARCDSGEVYVGGEVSGRFSLKHQRAPLLSHGFGKSAVSPASFSASVLAWAHAVNPILSTLNHLCRGQARQVFKPQACRFGFTVPKHPRLHDLCRLADPRRKYPDRILDGDPVDRSRPQGSYKVYGFFSPLNPSGKPGIVPPTGTGTANISAGGKSNQQIPATYRTRRTVEKVQYVAEDVIVGAFALGLNIFEVTRPGFKPTTAERVSYSPAEFASDQDGRFHAFYCTAHGVPCQAAEVAL